MAKRIIALFGGTFDPVHLGHTRVAASAAEVIGTERVVFIPAKRSALKTFSPVASDQDRFNMVQLAIAGQSLFELSDYELKNTPPSYTLDTVRHFRNKLGADVSIHWLVGADSIQELSHWYKIEQLIDECNLTIMLRAGYNRPELEGFTDIWGRERVEKLRESVVETPLIDINSTKIRQMLTSGEDVSQVLAPAVLEYIKAHNLYQSSGSD